MTTIVYRDGVIAYDSRKTAGGTITSDCHDKHESRGGVHFFFAGSVCDREDFIAGYLSGENVRPMDCGAITIQEGSVYSSGVLDDGRIWKCPIDKGDCYAMGSGQEFAWGAMEMGATAVEAVEAAKRRDVYSGGEVRVFEVRQ